MRNLSTYVTQHNRIAILFNMGEVLDVRTLTTTQKQGLLTSLESALSPESLTCDGELRGNKLREKTRMLQGAYSELQSIM